MGQWRGFQNEKLGRRSAICRIRAQFPHPQRKNGKWADTTDFSGKVKGYVCEWKGTAPKDAGPKDSELKAPKG